MKQKIEIEVDVPEGWEPTGEYRQCRHGETRLMPDGTACTWRGIDRTNSAHLILRRVEPVKESRWVNVYPMTLSSMYASRESVERVADVRLRKGVIRIDYENGKPVNVTLESVEGEG